MTSVTNYMNRTHATVAARPDRADRQYDPAQDYQGHSHKKLDEEKKVPSKVLTVALTAVSGASFLALVAGAIMTAVRAVG